MRIGIISPVRAGSRCLVRSGSRLVAIYALALLLSTPGLAWSNADSTRSAATRADGPRYTVMNFTVQYAEAHLGHPPLSEIIQLPIELGRVSDGFVAPRPDGPTVLIHLASTFLPPDDRFYASALAAINAALVKEFNRRGLVAVLVAPNAGQIERSTGKDLRPAPDNNLQLIVFTGRAIGIHTFASGDRIPEGERENNPRHNRILERSPVQPGGQDDLIREDKLYEYTARLNRHPGRRVDVQIRPARTAGGAYVDFLVTELKPWAVYGQYSNTGTSSTTKGRERFGFTHYQLTGHDDIFAVDYVTGDFDEVHAVSGFYDVPIYGTERFRARIIGAYWKFDSDLLGFPSEFFRGKNWTVGGLITANVFQHKDFFVDLVGGLRVAHADIFTTTGANDGEDYFFIPKWGITASQAGNTSAAFAKVTFEKNIASIAGTKKSELQQFGRGFDIDKNWMVMRFNAESFFYLEPLLFRSAWEDPSTPESSTLAHEIYASFRGQYSFDNRLIPNEMQTLGGLYSVRGYREAETSGDSIGVASVEYRFHVPRVFTPNRTPYSILGVENFKVVPQHVYGQPDWDLILRAFFDIGRSWRTRAVTSDINETLIGSGIGAELVLKQNLRARFEYGWPLKDTLGSDVGDGRARFVVRVQF